jgi:hypothetical protein
MPTVKVLFSLLLVVYFYDAVSIMDYIQLAKNVPCCFFFGYSSILKMEGILNSETSVDLYRRSSEARISTKVGIATGYGLND